MIQLMNINICPITTVLNLTAKWRGYITELFLSCIQIQLDHDYSTTELYTNTSFKRYHYYI